MSSRAPATSGLAGRPRVLRPKTPGPGGSDVEGLRRVLHRQDLAVDRPG